MYQPGLKVIQLKYNGMVRATYLLFILCLFFSESGLAQIQGQDPSKALRVKVTNIRKLEGQVMLAVYDRREDFLTDNVVMSAKVPVKSSEVVLDLDKLVTEHSYVISIYHDVNGNGELDTNLMSIPVEPYGFSNNNLGLIPIPNYDKSSFLMHDKLDSLEIELRGG